MADLRPSSPVIARLEPYPEYKDSGVEWLGEIPAHWYVTTLKRICAVVNGGTPKTSEPRYWSGSITWITPDDLGSTTGMVVRESDRSITSAGLESCGAQLVPEGSLVLSTRAPIGHLAMAGTDLCTNQGCRSLVFRSDESRRYAFYQLTAARSTLQSLGAGSTFRELSSVSLGTFAISAPPVAEQRAIADFLDREAERIDGLVAKQERLIDLLREKRTALISHVVTKGLDPDPPKYESGVPWLKNVPVGWQVLPLKRLVVIRYGLGEPPPENVDGLPLVRATDISNGRITMSGMRRVDPRGIASGRDIRLTEGDIIVVRSGAYTGDSAIVPRALEGALAGYDMFMRVRHSVPKFVAWAMLSRPVLAAQIRLVRARAAQPHLNAEELGSVVIAVPPLEQQAEIVQFLDQQTVRIEALIDQVSEAIDRLHEYRAALVSAAVTGKIDVRSHSAAEAEATPSGEGDA